MRATERTLQIFNDRELKDLGAQLVCYEVHPLICFEAKFAKSYSDTDICGL